MNSSTGQKPMLSEYQSNLEMLVQIPIFTGLPLESLKVLAYLCTRETFKAGEVIFHQHEVDPHAYFFIRGTVQLVLENEQGEEDLRLFGENDFIGGLTMFYDMKRLFTLKARSDVTCLMLSKEKFHKTLERFPEIAFRVFEGIAKSIYQWEYRVVNEHVRSCAPCRHALGFSMV